MAETRKDPRRVRRNSSKEFSRVSALLDEHINAVEDRVASLELEIAELREQIKKMKSRKKYSEELTEKIE